MRISYEELFETFRRILESRGLSSENAKKAAAVFAGNSLDGVYSHGINRFPRVIGYLDKEDIDPAAEPVCTASFGALERWDGRRGLGPLNAALAMDRACELARQYGTGVVALGNSNHWMRGGSYGWQAAEQGMIGICWSNTMPNMPAWGGTDQKIGNNPLVMAVPGKDGNHVVIDCALSQFSYGKLEEARLKGAELPVAGGYDSQGQLTKDPAAIEETRRVLPIGYWKGSGISIALDLIATVLTNGNSVSKVGTFDSEVGLSQVMIAMDPGRFNTEELTHEIVSGILADVKSSHPADEGREVRYPGERSLKTREENMKQGIPVLEEIWEKVRALEK
ncbi:MAG: 3-dehydro-L-gulonate 2-dehydrogenase [Eubacteriales bacterium]|nr:3-dehydro-L-gulonate 2-dehydrogenase [Eubacteriales bacterium]